MSVVLYCLFWVIRSTAVLIGASLGEWYLLHLMYICTPYLKISHRCVLVDTYQVLDRKSINYQLQLWLPVLVLGGLLCEEKHALPPPCSILPFFLNVIAFCVYYVVLLFCCILSYPLR